MGMISINKPSFMIYGGSILPGNTSRDGFFGENILSENTFASDAFSENYENDRFWESALLAVTQSEKCFNLKRSIFDSL